jgi:hypothetical protein
LTYDKQDWADGLLGGTPITAARLDHIEDGIEAAHTLAEAASSAVHTHVSADVTDATDARTGDTLVKRSSGGSASFARVYAGSSSSTQDPIAANEVTRKDYVDTTVTAAVATKSNTDHTHDYAASGHTHTVADVSNYDTATRDKIDDTIIAGSGITKLYSGGTLTLSASGGITSVGYDDLPAGTTLTVLKSGGVWPARPTSRADVIVAWKGADPSPSIVSSGTGGMLDDVDYRLVTS